VTEITIPNNFTGRDEQKRLMKYLDNGGLRAGVCWPRRYGKDLTMVHQTCKAMFERPGMYFHMLPNHRQARKVIWDGFDNTGHKILDTAFPKVLRENTNQTEMKITLRNGAIWQLVGSDFYDSIVGANPFGLTMSEAALSDPRAWSIFRPILAGNGGWAAFIATPRGYNWFYDIMELARSNPKWFYSHLGVAQTKHIPESVLEDERKEMPDELYRQEYECDFSAANVGAIFGRYIERAEKEGRITTLDPHVDGVGEVWVTSDIGYRDKAAWVWWRRLRGGFEIFHYDDGSGMDAEEWRDRLAKQPRADKLILPHDARVKTFQSKRSSVEVFLSNPPWQNCEVRVNERRRKADSINAGRMVLKACLISNADVCKPFLLAMRAYAYEYDEETKTFSSEPEHNWASHTADAFMEGAARIMVVEPPKPPQEKRIIVPPLNLSFTLDQLHESVGHNKTDGRL
jgi:phage terminase large subunit